MALRPVVLIGCGGSGGKVVQMVHAGLKERLRHDTDWDEEDLPSAWQCAIVDSPRTQEANIPGVPSLDPASYFSLSTNVSDYDDVVDHLANKVQGQERERLVGWLPKPPISVSLQVGAGRMRAVGRAMSVARFNKLGDMLGTTLENSKDGIGDLKMLARDRGIDDAVAAGTTPAVYVVSSLAGGTGAGVYIDVCDLLRTVSPELNSALSAILFTAEVFGDLANNDGLQPNSLAAISELMAGYFDQGRPIEPLYKAFGLPVGSAAVGSSGPNQTYVVGMSAMGGGQLDSVMDCYRAVSESLITAIWDSEVSDQFTQYSAGNWLENQKGNVVSWNFGNSVDLKGVVSSFGSAKLSVGLERFNQYASARLAREVVEFQRKGWTDVWRKRMDGDGKRKSNTNIDDIVEYVRREQGLKFVESCELREVNLGDELSGTDKNDQIQDAIYDPGQLAKQWKKWRGDVVDMLAAQPERSSSEWLAAICNAVPSKQGLFLSEVESQLSHGTDEFVQQAPDRLLAATSRSIAEFGVRPTGGILKFLDQHLTDASEQLTSEAQGSRRNISGWRERAGNEFVDAPNKLLIDQKSDRKKIEKAVQQAAGQAWYEANSMRAERSRDLIDEFRHQVVSPLLETVEQMANELNEGLSSVGDDHVTSWPGTTGVPPAFVPPPFEQCLISHGRWPELLNTLIAQSGEPSDQMRSDIGGGGFGYNNGAVEKMEPSALTFSHSHRWDPKVANGTGSIVELKHKAQPKDVLERARIWINRDGLPLGDFCGQSLDDYLAKTQQGRPVPDHRKRLDRFEIALRDTLNSTKPLVSIDYKQLAAVHPDKADELLNCDLIKQRLPISEGTPAYERAVNVLKEHQSQDGRIPTDEEINQFFSTEASRSETVTYVSRLASAIHPAAVTSITKPIVSNWNQISRPETFWGKRRTRQLSEFVPVPPSVLNTMIKGFFNARMLNLFPNPDPNKPDSGFSIESKDGSSLAFPWPLLAGHVPLEESYQAAWPAWLLESLPLAMCQFSLDRDAVAPYDRLFELGSASNTTQHGRDDLPMELKNAIDNGTKRSHSKVDLDPDVDGGSLARRDNCLDYLNAVLAYFRKEYGQPGELSLEELWKQRNGYELFGRIATVLDEELIPAVTNFDPSGGGVL